MLLFSVCLLSVASYASAAGSDLPPFIEKCSLSDPNLSECFKEKANLAIPFLVKGYKALSISQVLPATFDTAPCYADGISFIIYDTYSDSLKDLKITDALFDLKNNKAEFEAVMDRVEVTAKNYTILNGTFVGVKASGHGSFNMTMVKLVISFKGDIRKYKKGGEDYLELTNSKLVSNVDRGYYYFENLKSEEKDDMNAYIDENWRKFSQQLLPVVETYMKTFVYHPVNVIFKEVPINKMFLP
ncbi:hypothetical protein Trydic_g9014 [Trypoxylus dichotomus]